MYQVELEEVIGPAFESWPLISDATPRREPVFEPSTRKLCRCLFRRWVDSFSARNDDEVKQYHRDGKEGYFVKAHYIQRIQRRRRFHRRR